MGDFKYIIESITDKDGNKKESLLDGLFFIKFARVGSSAFLIEYDSDRTLRTSTVEEIIIWDNVIKITTRNSIYDLKLYNDKRGLYND